MKVSIREYQALRQLQTLRPILSQQRRIKSRLSWRAVGIYIEHTPRLFGKTFHLHNKHFEDCILHHSTDRPNEKKRGKIEE